jgi:ferritin-like metal-binding protein YciE
MKQPKNLSDLLVLKLSALYDTEQQLAKALPKLAEAATDPDLKGAFRTHLDETRVHIERLESVFRLLGEKPRSEKCEGIRGIAEDGAWAAKTVTDEKVRDSLLASAASYAEHYEMAGYIAAIRWAKRLGHRAVVTTLSKTLQEEAAADEHLEQFAEGKLDYRAEHLAVA